MRPPTRLSAIAGLAATLATPAFADHPGENLDVRMTEMEGNFQIIDIPAPEFEFQDAEGKLVRLSDFSDKIVVLNFTYVSCPDICPAQSEKIAGIQASINDGPMKNLVQFISISTDPLNGTPEVLHDYAGSHGFDPVNWAILTKTPEQPNDATRQLARDYGLEFTLSADSAVIKDAAVTHVIDIGGRFAGKFHGMNFKNVNLILYVSELINSAQHRKREQG